MISLPRRRAAVILPVMAVLAGGAILATTTFAGASTASLDLAVATSKLKFQPPAEMPDSGFALVTISNVGTTRPSAVSIEVDTLSRLKTANANGVACKIVAQANGTDRALCGVPRTRIPGPGRSVALALTVEISSPPGDCSCVPMTIRLPLTGDTNTANNVATAEIVR